MTPIVATRTTHLLYLHGFRSSPASFKARAMQSWLAATHPGLTWWCPQLPPSPAAAIALAEAGTASWPAATTAVVGSSLGGFYATVLAQSHSWRCVVINPAVNPARDLAAYIGEQTAFHDPSQRLHFDAAFIDELRSMEPRPPCDFSQTLAVIATGDEVLDWHEMHARYEGAQRRVVEGSDHALSDFADHLPAIADFLGLSSADGSVPTDPPASSG
jgi:hypothetical protein